MKIDSQLKNSNWLSDLHLLICYLLVLRKLVYTQAIYHQDRHIALSSIQGFCNKDWGLRNIAVVVKVGSIILISHPECWNYWCVLAHILYSVVQEIELRSFCMYCNWFTSPALTFSFFNFCSHWELNQNFSRAHNSNAAKCYYKDVTFM